MFYVGGEYTIENVGWCSLSVVSVVRWVVDVLHVYISSEYEAKE